MSKRRRGFPSEARVRRGRQVVHANKELHEKLGRNDLCPCGSGRRFQEVLHAIGPVRRFEPRVVRQAVMGVCLGALGDSERSEAGLRGTSLCPLGVLGGSSSPFLAAFEAAVTYCGVLEAGSGPLR